MAFWKVVLDPNYETVVAAYAFHNSPQGIKLRFGGAWCPGPGQQTWGPTGDPNTQLGGANKWCVMVRIYVNNTHLITFPFKSVLSPDGFELNEYNLPATDYDIIKITAQINDDHLGDNYFPNKEAAMMGFAKTLDDDTILNI